jgi:hypothetical protein
LINPFLGQEDHQEGSQGSEEVNLLDCLSPAACCHYLMGCIHVGLKASTFPFRVKCPSCLARIALWQTDLQLLLLFLLLLLLWSERSRKLPRLLFWCTVRNCLLVATKSK